MLPSKSLLRCNQPHEAAAAMQPNPCRHCVALSNRFFYILPDLDNYDTVLLLQGGKDIPPVKWRTRAIRRTPGWQSTSPGFMTRDGSRCLRSSLGAFDGMQEEARHKEERRHRMALMHTRLCMHKLVCAEVLAPAALPIYNLMVQPEVAEDCSDCVQALWRD